MDIFKNIPFLNKGGEVEAIDPTERKKARVQYHREHVRNGPFGTKRVIHQDLHALAITFFSKEEPRRAKRAAKRNLARNYDRSKQQHFSERSESALLRGQLQAVGLLPYIHTTTLDPIQARKSVIYLVHRFADAEGTVEVTEDLVRDSLQSALNRWESLVRRPITKIPAEYVLPVQVAA